MVGTVSTDHLGEAGLAGTISLELVREKQYKRRRLRLWRSWSSEAVSWKAVREPNLQVQILARAQKQPLELRLHSYNRSH